jgi:hypothetical protein
MNGVRPSARFITLKKFKEGEGKEMRGGESNL